jgi:phosphate:Na+ symporter
MGANIGTTATALIAMFNMDAAAKKTALSHFLFNIGGVLIFLPVLLIFGHRLGEVTMDPALALANIHLIFNIATSLIFIALIGPFTRLVDMLLGEGKMDFERLELPVFDESLEFDAIRGSLERESSALLAFLQENYNLVTLSIETNYPGIAEAAGKRIDYIDFLKKEYMGYFSRVMSQARDEQESQELIRLINQFDYLFQMHDSINDLFDTRKVMSEHYIELKSDILLLIREMSNQTLVLFDLLRASAGSEDTQNLKQAAREMQTHLDAANRKLLSLLTDPERRDAGAMTNFITYSQRLKDKLVNYSKTRVKTP